MKKYIVAGAGILGASTAYHLAKQGADVTIVDRNDAGQATEAAAGIVCPWLTKRVNSAWYHLVTEGARYYPALIHELEEEGETQTGYSKVGAINIFSKESMLNDKLALAKDRRKTVPEMGDISKLSIEETQALFPPLSGEYAALHISGGARVNGAALRDALLRGAQKNGAEFIHSDAELLTENGRVKGMTLGDQSIHYADHVLVTGGVWAKELFASLGRTVQITSQKAQIVHLRLPDTDTSRWPVVMPPYGQYFLAFGQGKIVVGATQENDRKDTRVTMGGVHQVLEKALKVAPGFAECTYEETKTGFRPFTPGSLPVIGEVAGVKGLYAANGLGASGLTSGPFLGKQLAKLAMGEKTEINLDHYRITEAIQ
ncbi:FAD-binding oxidoreductase [Halobacillus rhizosphaerae]|uniref:NAD(P)/FAD-dependent oxidoreductase n=1 Tax=Halobacillus rhizosphaerae TaxID=3064889 RepID=UPI00398B2998